MRIRVFACVSVAATLLGLAACRSNPGVAAYVGDRTITEDRVTQLFDGYVAWGMDQGPDFRAPSRTIIVNILVRGAVCERAREKLSFSVTEPDIPQGQPELLTIAAKGQACEEAMPVEEAKPTEAEAREIFEIGVANRVWEPDAAAREIPAIMSNPNVAGAISRKKAIEKGLTGVDVTVNPKYGKLAMPLISFQGNIPAVAVTFGEAGPVTDRPVVPSAPAQAS